MTHKRATFPEDHYITHLRGYPHPRPHTMRRLLAMRAAWLTRKIESRILSREPFDLYLEELATIAEVTALLPTESHASATPDQAG